MTSRTTILGQGMAQFMGTARRHAGRPERERGANLVEYILLVTLVALAVIAAVVFLRGQASNKFGEAGSKLSSNGIDTPLIVPCGAWVERTETFAGYQPTCPDDD